MKFFEKAGINFILFFSLVNPATLEEEQTYKSKRSIQTAGRGCDIIRPALYREPIPNTDLLTGTFYIVRMKSIKNVKAALSFGYITWSGRTHTSGHKYVFADSHNNMEDYTEGAHWYKDSQWAFLKSRYAGWYHLINCGYSSLYATWSNLEEEDDHSGAVPMVLVSTYPGNHSKIDFLFKPVQKSMEGSRFFQIRTKCFEGGIISVSDTTYKGESTYLQVESEVVWKRRVAGEGNEGENKALFIFENSKDEDVDYASYKADGGQYSHDSNGVACVLCSCEHRILFTVVFTFWACVIVSFCWSKKSVMLDHLSRGGYYK